MIIVILNPQPDMIRVESRIIVINVYIDMYSDIERTAIQSSQW